jgi:hypothetical protein
VADEPPIYISDCRKAKEEVYSALDDQGASAFSGWCTRQVCDSLAKVWLDTKHKGLLQPF